MFKPKKTNTVKERYAAAGVVHDFPSDLKNSLISDANLLAKWDSHHLPEMSGFAGQQLLKNQKHVKSISNVYLMISHLENVDPVAGPVVLILEKPLKSGSQNNKDLS